MSQQTVDERVVALKFDNKQFEAGVSESLGSLEKLNSALDMKGASKGLQEVEKSVSRFDMSPMEKSIDAVSRKFTALEVASMTVINRITNGLMDMGKRLIDTFAIEPVSTGFDEYELKMNSVQTIMSGTGESIEVVNKALDELNKYSDDTIYSFSDMTNNIAKFTNAGVKLKPAVAAIKGVANAAAHAGANAQEASRAMYNFSQALSTGSVQLIDWKSIENANMATQRFREEIIHTAEQIGTLKRAGDGLWTTLKGTEVTVNTMRDTLKDKWFTSDVLVKVLNNYADAETDIGREAMEAATRIKTFSQMVDTLKESAQSGWAETWQLIAGDLDKATELWTGLQKFFDGIISANAEARNALIGQTMNLKDDQGISGREMLIRSLMTALNSLKAVMDAVKKAWTDVFGEADAQKLRGLIQYVGQLAEKFKTTEEQAQKIRNVFKGFFAIVDMLVTTIRFGIRVVTTMIHALVTTVVGLINMALTPLAGMLGAVKFSFDALAGGMYRAAQAMTSFLEKLKAYARGEGWKSDAGTGVAESVQQENDILEGEVKRRDEIMQEMGNAGKPTNWVEWFTQAKSSLQAELKEFWTWLTTKTELVANTNNSILTLLGNVLTMFKNKVVDAASALNEFMNTNVKPSQIIALGIIVGTIVAMKKLNDAFEVFEDLIEAVTRVVNSVAKVIKGAANVLNGFAMKLKAQAFKDIGFALIEFAGAIAIVTASLYALSKLDSNGLNQALTTVAKVSVALVAVMGLMAIFGKIGDFKSVALSLLSFSASLVLVAKALQAFLSLSGVAGWDVLAKVGALAAGLLVVSKLLGSHQKTFYGGAITMIAFAAALRLMVSTLQKLADAKIEFSLDGLKAIGTAIAILSAMMLSAKNVRFGAAVTLIAAVGSLHLLINMLKNLTSEDISHILPGLTIVEKVFQAYTAVLLAGSIAGKNASKAGSAILKMSASLLIITGVIALLTVMDNSEITLAMATITKLFDMFAVITAMSLLAGRNAGKAGSMILMMSGAIVVLTGSLAAIAAMGVDENLKKAADLLTQLMVVMTIMIGVTEFMSRVSKDSKSEEKISIAPIIALTAAVIAMVGAVAALSLLDQSGANIAGPVAALSALMIMFDLMLVVSSKAEIAQKSVWSMTGVIVVLGSVLVGMSALKTENAIQNAGAIAILLGALGVVYNLLSYLKGLNAKTLGSLAIMAAIGAAFGALCGVLEKLDIAPSIETAASISLLLIGLSVAFNILKMLGPAASDILPALGVMALVIAAVGAIIGGLAYALRDVDYSELEANLNKATLIFEKIGEALGMLVGGVIGGVAKGTMMGVGDGIAAMGRSLGEFGEGIKPLIDVCSNIDAGTLSSIKNLATAVLAITAADIISGLARFVGLGKSSLSSFGSQLRELGNGLAAYAGAVSAYGSDWSPVEKSTEAALQLATLADAIPNSGGILGGIVGNNDIKDFGAQLAGFAQALVDYATIAGRVSDWSPVKRSVDAAGYIVGLANSIPNTGGWIGKIVGNNDIDDFGSRLYAFANGLVLYDQTVAQISDWSPVKPSVDAGALLASFAQQIPNSGGLIGSIMGNNDIDDFGSKLGGFASGLVSYVNKLPSSSGVWAKVKPSVDAAQLLVNLAQTIPNGGGLLAKWFGDNNMSDFADGIRNLGVGLNAFSTSINGVDYWSIYNAYLQLNNLVLLAQRVQNTDFKSLMNFGDTLRFLAQSGLTEFLDVFKKSDPQVIQEAKNLSEKFAAALKDQRPTFYQAGIAMIDGVVVGIKANVRRAYDAGTTLGNQLNQGLRDSLEIHSPSEQGEDAGSNYGGSVASGAVSQAPATYNAGQVLGFNLDSGIGGYVSQAWNKGKSYVDQFLNGFTGGLPNISMSFSNFWNSVSQSGAEGYGKFSDLMKKFWDSSATVSDNLANLAKNWKEWLGIDSSNAHYFNLDEMEQQLNTFLEDAANMDFDLTGSLTSAGAAAGQSMADAFKLEFHKDFDMYEYTYLGQQIGDGMMIGINNAIISQKKSTIRNIDEIISAAGKGLEAFKGYVEARKAYNVMSDVEELEGYQRLQQMYIEGSKERMEIDEKVYNLKKEIVKGTYEYSKQWIEEQKYYELMTLEEELAAWERMQKRYMEGSEQRKAIDREVFRVRKELQEEAYNQAIENIEDLKFYGKLSLAEELAAYKKIQNTLTLNKSQAKNVKRQIYTLEQEITRQQQEYESERIRIEQEAANKRAQLQQELADKEKSIQEQLNRDIDQLNKDYESKLESRTKQLYNSWGLFDKVKRKNYDKGVLMENLQGQVGAFAEWMAEMGKLSGRGLSDELIAELKEMGPGALGQIKALNSMTDEELQKYNTLWSEKMAMAKTEAVDEMKQLRIDTDAQIAQLRVDAANELEQYRQLWAQKMAQIAADTESQLAALAAKMQQTLAQMNQMSAQATKTTTKISTLPQLTNYIADKMTKPNDSKTMAAGKQVASGLISGLMVGLTSGSATGILKGVGLGLTSSLTNIVKSGFKINSPSKVFMEIGESLNEGLSLGIVRSTKNSEEAVEDMGSEVTKQMTNVVGRLASLVQNGMDDSLTITPVLDLSEIETGLDEMDNMTAGRSVRLAGSLSGIADYDTRSTSGENANVVQELRELRTDVSALAAQMTRLQVVMDSGTLVGEIVAPMDQALGVRALRNSR